MRSLSAPTISTFARSLTCQIPRLAPAGTELRLQARWCSLQERRARRAWSVSNPGTRGDAGPGDRVTAPWQQWVACGADKSREDPSGSDDVPCRPAGAVRETAGDRGQPPRSPSRGATVPLRQEWDGKAPAPNAAAAAWREPDAPSAHRALPGKPAGAPGDGVPPVKAWVEGTPGSSCMQGGDARCVELRSGRMPRGRGNGGGFGHRTPNDEEEGSLATGKPAGPAESF